MRRHLALLLPFAAVFLCAASHPEQKTFTSPDRRFSWVEGQDHITLRLPRKKPERLRLPPVPSGSARRILFAEHGRYFCLVDEEVQEVGLHIGLLKGPEKAKAVVFRSWLRLMDQDGHILWKKRMPDKHIVGRLPDTKPLQISNNGTLAILLQDSDPYTKAKPALFVYSPGGRKRLSLDYTAWKSIDEFALSRGGRFLAVRGYGRLPEAEGWERAFGFYRTDREKKWLVEQPETKLDFRLRAVSDDGWACCGKVDGRLFALSCSSELETLDKENVYPRFGVMP